MQIWSKQVFLEDEDGLRGIPQQVYHTAIGPHLVHNGPFAAGVT